MIFLFTPCKMVCSFADMKHEKVKIAQRFFFNGVSIKGPNLGRGHSNFFQYSPKCYCPVLENSVIIHQRDSIRKRKVLFFSLESFLVEVYLIYDIKVLGVQTNDLLFVCILNDCHSKCSYSLSR